MPKPYPKEFRQNVVEVARAREAGTTLKEIAKDFGILRVVSDELDLSLIHISEPTRPY